MRLKIVHWNCFKLTRPRLGLLKLFVHVNKPDIVSINELKVRDEVANIMLRFKNYSTYHKVRQAGLGNPNCGGGVALLVRDGLPHSQIRDIDSELEAIGVKINLINSSFNVYSMYCPPGMLVPLKFFH